MDTVLFLTLGLVVFITPVTSSTSGLKKVPKTQILGFDWKNCGAPDASAVLKTLTVSPDPIVIPGDLQASASGSTTVELSAPLAVSTQSTVVLYIGCEYTEYCSTLYRL
ncbi:ganglioside GM2 activator [Anarrhichthys ocellatus]|uniref:ganglioside GM2 activator n=1 Tax=Anarrhichthys ocellatus TaxID=433405 RepID=UPI0012ED3042|nr:ganglioside GM2 activator [Anarrhichthys ocellatus]